MSRGLLLCEGYRCLTSTLLCTPETNKTRDTGANSKLPTAQVEHPEQENSAALDYKPEHKINTSPY